MASCQSEPCPFNQIDVTDGVVTYLSSDGPYRYTVYVLIIVFIRIVSCLLFTGFLPKDKEECTAWNEIGEKSGGKYVNAVLSLSLIMIFITVINYYAILIKG